MHLKLTGQKSDWIEVSRCFIQRIQLCIRVQEAYLFGSRALGRLRDEWTDYDLLIVSPDFAGVHPIERPLLVDELWNYDYGGADFLCYTPEEFERSRRMATIVADVMTYAVRVDGGIVSQGR